MSVWLFLTQDITMCLSSLSRMSSKGAHDRVGLDSLLVWEVFFSPTLSVERVCPEDSRRFFQNVLRTQAIFFLVPCFYNWKLNLLWRVTKWTPNFIVASQVSWASLTDVIYKLWRGHLTLEGHLLTGVFLFLKAISTDPSG